jgi:hypothetical protein
MKTSKIPTWVQVIKKERTACQVWPKAKLFLSAKTENYIALGQFAMNSFSDANLMMNQV